MDHFEVQAAIGELRDQRGVQIEDLGRSVLGVHIPMIVLGEGERTVFFVGGIQGNEGAQTALLLAFVKEAVSLYGRGATLFSFPLTYLFSQYRICVIPLLNPDGMQYVNKGPGAENPLRERLAAMSSGAGFAGWRANARGVDLTHNFGAGFLSQKRKEQALGIFGGRAVGYGGECPESEPESAALAGCLRGCAQGLVGVLCLREGQERIECSCEDNLSAKSMAVGRSLARLSALPLVRPELLPPDGGLGDWCIRALSRPAYSVFCQKGTAYLEALYARVRRMLFTFPTLL